MVQWCNHTIEDIVKKSMQVQSDWCPALPLVLFAIRTAQHSSTGFSPFSMSYNYDPILPFQYADKHHQGLLSDIKADCESDGNDEVCHSLGTDHLNSLSDPLISEIQNLEDQ